MDWETVPISWSNMAGFPIRLREKGINIVVCSKFLKTARMSTQNLTNGGVIYLLPNYLLKVLYLVPLLYLWRSLMQSGVDAGMTLAQMLTYTYLGAVFSDLLVVHTQASSWLYEGMFISLYQRPMGVILHLVSQTMGKWVPQFLLFTVPMLLAAPLFGVNLTPYSLWAIPSLLLCVSLGFAVDILFACVTIRLQNASWLVYVIRNAIQALFSGSVIPFAILPWGIGTVFQYIPFGSLAAAPLSIYTGLEQAAPIIALQIFWNLLLWPCAILAFSKSRERMVSDGG